MKAFFLQLKTYFGYNVDQFPTDEDKALFTTLYMRGWAYSWIMRLLQDYLRNPGAARYALRENETNKMFESYTRFEKAMTTIFGEVDPDRTSKRQLASLW
jgi:hypothetical protein